MKWIKILTALSIASAMVITATSCSEDDKKDSSSSSTSYGGPGSEWNMTLSDNGTFVATHAPTPGSSNDLTVNGTWTTTASGFIKIGVTSATGTNAPSAGDAGYALNIPGFVFLLKPMDSNGAIIPMIVKGSCPSSDFNMNWVVTNYGGSDAHSTSADIFGTADWSSSGGTLTLASKYALNAFTSVAAGDVMQGSCSSGFMTVGSGPDAYMWLSSSGAILVKTTHDNGVIVATPRTSYTAANLDGDYSGLLFNEGTGGSETTFPVKVTIGGSGTTATAYDFTDIDAGTTSSSVASISFSSHNDPANGFMKGSVSGGGELICQVMEDVSNSGKNLLFCASVSPDNSTQLFNVLLVSQ